MLYSEAFLIYIGNHTLSNAAMHKRDENIKIISAYSAHDFQIYGIDSDQRQAHFLGQICIESQYFCRTEENLNYSHKRFHTVFPSHSKSYDFWESQEIKSKAAGQCVDRRALAGNVAYSNRMGDSDYLSGDGYRYRGRGFIQVTGKENYTDVARMTGLDVVNNPDLLADPRNALMSACCFWQRSHLNTYADRNDFSGLTHAINGGYREIQARKECTLRVMDMQKTWSGTTTSV